MPMQTVKMEKSVDNHQKETTEFCRSCGEEGRVRETGAGEEDPRGGGKGKCRG